MKGYFTKCISSSKLDGKLIFSSKLDGKVS